MPDRAILASYAHPDDEQLVSGTLKMYTDLGVRTAILSATRGEVGEISDPALATPETLGQVREGELRRAAAIVGVKDVFFLEYRDSGMINTAPNQDPRAFINAAEDEAVGGLVKVIRAFKPTLVFTFDETGGYGHPDHLAISKWTVLAFRAAGDPSKYPEAGAPFAPSRLFFASIPRSGIRMLGDLLRANGLPQPFGDLDPDQFGIADERLTNRINVQPYADLKRQSLEAHQTQNNPNSPIAKMPPEMWDTWRATEHFVLVEGVPFPAGADSADLFAGLA